MSEIVSAPFCFEPMRFLVESPSSHEVSTRQGRVYRRRIDGESLPLSAPSHAYFFQKAIAQNEEEFEGVNINNQIRKIITKATNNVLKQLREKFEAVVPSSEVIKSIIPEKIPEHYYYGRILRELPMGIYFHKSKKVAIIPISPVSIYLFGCTKKDISETIAKIIKKCKELNEVTSDFGLKFNGFLSSREYQEDLLNNLSHVEKIESGDPKNDFEKEVIQECEKITTSFLSNVNIKFKEPTETFEYDIFLSFGEQSRVIIEPTDYESLKNEIQNGKFGQETMKSRIILGTMDKARRLQAESVIIVKGFPKEKFSALKSLADSRDVRLLSNETYKSNLPYVLMDILNASLIKESLNRI